MNMLYTYQRRGHDITKPFAPLGDYAAGGAYAALSTYLGWRTWVWCMPTLADFDNEWFNPSPNDCVLWRLSVPAEYIKWLALNAQCENCTPVETWFYSSANEIRSIGDIPQALVCAPVLQDWAKVTI